MEAKTFQGALLWGVTGSGKTEVYLQTIETLLQDCGGMICLVPEIALTPQTLKVVFDRIDQMKKVRIRATKPEVIDFFEPFLLPALALLCLQVVALFGLRFTPW